MPYSEWAKQYLLNYNEKAAVNQYISSELYILNNALRNGYALTDDQKKMQRNLDKALAKLPVYQGTVVRSLDFDYEDERQEFLENLKIGDDYEDVAYQSTSPVVYNETAKVQIKVINSKNGKDLRVINSREQEVLFARNTRFKIIDMYFKDGIRFLEMIEDDE